MQALRFIAFFVYLFAWLVFAVGAIAGAIPRIQKQSISIRPATIIGTALQIGSVAMITLQLGPGSLRPNVLELAAVAILAPFGAVLFASAFRAGRGAGPDTLVTQGIYARLRHPMYLAFLAMLLATGFLASAGQRLLVAVAVYLAGSELRIDAEEEDLARTFRGDYEKYRARTCWRYLPGLR